MPAVSIADFRAGLVIPGDPSDEEQPGFAPDGALLTAQNVEFFGTGGVRGRRGRAPVLGSMNERPLGLFRHYPREGRRSYGPFKPLGVQNSDAIDGDGFDWVIPSQSCLRDVDDVWAQYPLAAGAKSEYLDVTDFSISLPADAEIAGIEVRILRRAQPYSRCRDATIQLLRGGAPVGDNYASPDFNWAQMFGEGAYGGAGDLWGETWTAADFDATFGIRIQVEADAAVATAPEVERVIVLVWVKEATTPTFLAASVAPTATRLVTWDGAAWSTPAGSSLLTLPGARPRFVTVPERSSTYIFDGVNQPMQFTGSVFIGMEPTGELAIPKGPYAALWKNRLFVSNPDEGDFSVYATAINEPANFPADLQLSLNDPTGGQITGICALPDRLVMLKETSLFAFIGDVEFGGELVRYSSIGCVAPDSVQVAPYGIFYVARGGVYLTDGSSGSPLELSAAIRPLFVGRTDTRTYPNALGFYFPRRDQYWLLLEPGADTIYVAHRVVGDAGLQFGWSTIPNTGGTLFAAAVALTGAHDDGDAYVAGTDGLVREWDVGQLDDGAAIPVEVMTVRGELDRDSRLARLVHLKPYFRALGSIMVALRYDGALTDDLAFTVGVLGEAPRFQQPRITVVDQSVWGRWLQWRVTSQEGPTFELHRLNGDLMLRSVRRWP